jgi:hypothetical protein
VLFLHPGFRNELFFTRSFLTRQFVTSKNYYRRHSQLSEQNDVLWDDPVAPELAFDFDSPHISTAEAAVTLFLAFAGIGGFYQFIKWTDPPSKNPAVCRTADMLCDCLGAPYKK